ncbi:MAG TPA: hypothetical protein K8V56_06750 [Sporosarcina psychrophila]|uniref:Uncharacterized protein n=1 Tax=Sporosarcina psychrophila TaxID=1476 RepID=A0A921FXA9_SPOPS|nr:hypothetical protein [Sporosarcina psychrophila]
MPYKVIAIMCSIVAIACSVLVLASAHFIDDWTEEKLSFSHEVSAASPSDRVDRVSNYLVKWQSNMTSKGFTDEQVEEGKKVVAKHLADIKLRSKADD